MIRFRSGHGSDVLGDPTDGWVSSWVPADGSPWNLVAARVFESGPGSQFLKLLSATLFLLVYSGTAGDRPLKMSR